MFRMSAMATFVFAIAAPAFATPIPNDTFAVKKAGWFPSVATPCPVVCKRKQARAEMARFSIANPNPNIHNKVTYVCKAPTSTPNEGAWKGKGWLFGNNFQARYRDNVCIVSTASVKAQRRTRFMCLCVR